MLDDCTGEFSPGIIYMAAGPGGYVGLVRVEGNRLNVAAALDPAVVRDCGGPGRAAAAIYYHFIVNNSHNPGHLRPKKLPFGLPLLPF